MATRIGFRQARRRLCQALENPSTIIHEERDNRETKNLLATGVVTPADVLGVVRAASGNDYEDNRHHQDASLVVHGIRRTHRGGEWYLGRYCIEPNVVVISVHH